MARFRSISLTLAVLALPACGDLGVTNPNEPDRTRVFHDAGTAEALIGSTFNTWHQTVYAYAGVGAILSTTAFQHSTPFCQASSYSRLPRFALPTSDFGYGVYLTYPWDDLYRVLTPLAEGLRALQEAPSLQSDLGEERADRLITFARFVQGLGHGSLALLFDRAAILDETTAVDQSGLVGYEAVMDTALAFLETAAERAAGKGWVIPAEWMSAPIPADQLARLAHSYAARFRAAVARTPAERAAVDWAAVMADVEAGIVDSWIMDMDPHAGWYNSVVDMGTNPGWAMDTYFIIGMADQSGSYQRWLDVPLVDRRPQVASPEAGVLEPVLIVTPDARFPQGATLAEQEAHPGSLYVIPNGLQGEIDGQPRAWNIQSLWLRPDRGSWRWSYYWHVDGETYTYWVDFHWPEITLAEMRLLEAEARLRTGDAAGAAALVNISRVAAGLSPADAAGTNVECVPRLPDSSCGDLMEMLKWEKRLETHMKGAFGAPWYFDGRGWGDLYEGTYLHLPIPCDELVLMGADGCNTFGGDSPGPGTAPRSSYAWPGEH